MSQLEAMLIASTHIVHPGNIAGHEVVGAFVKLLQYVNVGLGTVTAEFTHHGNV